MVLQNRPPTAARAFGVLIYPFLVGKSPFSHEDENAIYQRTCRGEVTQNLLEGCSPSIRRTDWMQCERRRRDQATAWFRGIDWGKVSAHRSKPPLLPMFEATEIAGTLPMIQK
jgi:hypothetical protein